MKTAILKRKGLNYSMQKKHALDYSQFIPIFGELRIVNAHDLYVRNDIQTN